METKLTAMTQEQLAELKGLVSFWIYPVRAVLFSAFIYVISKFFAWCLNLLSVGGYYWLIPVLMVGFWVFSRSKNRTGGRELRRNIKQDIAQGLVQVQNIKPKKVVLFEEAEDEGPVFLVSDESGVHVLFCGQDMAFAQAEGFPWSEISIFKAPISQFELGIEPLGESVAVDQTYPPLSYETCKELGCFKQCVFTLTEDQVKLIFNNNA